jgi:hypothetical protein
LNPLFEAVSAQRGKVPARLLGVWIMARVPPFHWKREASKPPQTRAYHANDACPAVRLIPTDEREGRSGGHRHYQVCERLNRAESNPWV